MAYSTLTVSQVNFFIKSLLEGDGRLNDVFVTGEISNCTRNTRSGHLYFSLKDERSVLRAVMFAASARRLRFTPEDGLKVLVRGRISVYEPSGQYQLYAEDIQPEGIGALGLAFEQLKNKLAAEGLFDPEHKRPLPRYPRCIGVITSPSGAAIRDILQVTARRWPAAEILFCPAPVQGAEAPEKLTEAVRLLGARPDCDVIILGRGGGSAEDLWAFNSEALVRAIYDSRAPVVSAVGHETDFTLCDFVADLRAPTPSAAAELCTPDGEQEYMRVADLESRLVAAAGQRIGTLRQQLDMLTLDSPMADPAALLAPHRRRLAELYGGMLSAYVDILSGGKNALAVLSGRLDALSPLKVLARGYSVVTDEKGRPLTDAGKTAPGEIIRVRMERGNLKAKITERQGEESAGEDSI